MYATIHAKAPAAGLYRSEDAGATWKQMNDQDGTAWYYSQVRCDPTNPDHVIQLNAQSRESKDAGKTLTPFAAGGVHSDHHALWISDDDPDHMILGGDGGVYTTYDAGRTWDHNESIVAGQFYAIAVDDVQPFYNVYGGLQDNQTWGGPSRTRNNFGPTNGDWFRMAGGDGFYAVPDPLDNNLVYAESQTGGVVRYDARTGQTKNIRPAPKPGERFRFNWSAPILPSKHDVKSVFMAAQFVFRSTDRGDSWEKISPDLTRGIDRNKLPMRGGVPDSTALGRNEGTAEFSNITTIDQSPLKKDLLAVGTDDGLIQITRDGGKTWTKTDKFPSVPETTFVSRVVWSQAAEGTLYATLDGHRSNDFKPYVVKSTDYGTTWTSIAAISRTAARCRSSANIRGNRICSSWEPSSARTSPSTAARTGRSSRAASRAYPCTTCRSRRARTTSSPARTDAGSTSSTISRRSSISRTPSRRASRISSRCKTRCSSSPTAAGARAWARAASADRIRSRGRTSRTRSAKCRRARRSRSPCSMRAAPRCARFP